MRIENKGKLVEAWTWSRPNPTCPRMPIQLPDTYLGTADLALRLGLAVAAGLILGVDREWRGHSAGVRTHALVALSSALVTISALELHHATRAAGDSSDVLRVVQGLAQAIGFIAAGTIYMARGRVKDLTTAVNIWLASALGIAAGAGQVKLLLFGTGLTMVLLLLSPVIDRIMQGRDDDQGSRPPPTSADDAHRPAEHRPPHRDASASSRSTDT